MVHQVAVAVRADVAVIEKCLAVFHARIAFLEICPPVAQRLHLRAREHDPGLELLFDEVVVVRPAVRGDDFLRLIFLFHRGAVRPLLEMAGPPHG